MNTPETQFANEFRRVKACGRCSRLKTKCSYDSPESRTCRRCAKGGYSCQVATAQDRPRRTSEKRRLVDTSPGDEKSPGSASNGGGGGGAESYAYLDRIRLESRPVGSSLEEKNEKIAQLARVIKEAQQEISQLEDNTPGSSSSSNNNYAATPGKSHPSSIMEVEREYAHFNNDNTIAQLADVGLMSREEALFYYSVFSSQMSCFLAFDFDNTKTLDEMEKEAPVCALTMVVSASVTSRLTNSRELVRYMERFILERCVMNGEKSLDMIRALLTMVTFIHPSSDRLVTYFLFAISMAQVLNLGSIEDVKLSTTPGDSPEKQRAMLSVRTFVAVCTTATAMAVNSGRTYILGMIPMHNNCADLVMSYGTDIDRLIVYLHRMITTGHEGVSTLKNYMRMDQPTDVVQQTLTNYKSRLDELHSATEMVMGDPPTNRLMTIVHTMHETQTVALHEYALNNYLFGKERAPSDVVATVAYEIVAPARRLIDRFVEHCKKRSFMPKYFYFTPLGALGSLLRVRILLWSYGYGVNIVDVDAQFKRVKEAWLEMTPISYTARTMFELVERLDRWVQLRLSGTGINGTASADSVDSESRAAREAIASNPLGDHCPMMLVPPGMSKLSNGSNIPVEKSDEGDQTRPERAHGDLLQRIFAHVLRNVEERVPPPRMAQNNYTTANLTPPLYQGSPAPQQQQVPSTGTPQQQQLPTPNVAAPLPRAVEMISMVNPLPPTPNGGLYQSQGYNTPLSIDNFLSSAQDFPPAEDFDGFLKEIFGDEIRAEVM